MNYLSDAECAAKGVAAPISSSKDYERNAVGRYPDPAFFLPISAEAQIFMHNRAISGVGWKL
jgi:hypothetical protein